MQSSKRYLLPVLAVVLAAPQVWAQTNTNTPSVQPMSPLSAPPGGNGPNWQPTGQKETVTFLGVETAPVNRTLGAQLGLAREMGLVVVRVADDSPAAASLKEDDVLVKFEDQLLVNMPQLGALVRSKKSGDEVKLTVIRKGKETTVKAKLTSREMSRPQQVGYYQDPGMFNAVEMFNGPDMDVVMNLNRLGLGPDHARDVLRIIGGQRAMALNDPRVHVGQRGQQGGTTILDLPRSNFAYSDDEGSVEINSENDQRTLIVKDSAGKVLFNGPLNNDADREKLPADVAKRLDKLDLNTLNFEPTNDFKTEVVPLPSTPAKRRITREGDDNFGRTNLPSARPF